MSKTRIASVFLLASLLAGGAAHAEESGFYVGAGAGNAEQSGAGFSGNDTEFKLFGGYSFNSYFAAEGGYVDAGKMTDSDGSLRLAVKSHGFFAAGIARLPLDEYLAPYVKLGYVFYDTRASVSSSVASLSESDSDQNLLYGGGLEFRVGGHFRLRLEYEEIDVDDANFHIISLLGAYRF